MRRTERAAPREQSVTLRIQRSPAGELVTLTISGALVEEYVAELQKVVETEEPHRAVILDLQEVTHVSREAMSLLARLEASGARLVRCPEYLRQWISREGA